MKKFRPIQTVLLLVGLLFFAGAFPAMGDTPVFSDEGAVMASLEQGGEVPAPAFVPVVLTYEQGLVAAVDLTTHVVLAKYQTPFIVQRGSGFASARHDKAKARAPDKHSIITGARVDNIRICESSHLNHKKGRLLS